MTQAKYYTTVIIRDVYYKFMDHSENATPPNRDIGTFSITHMTLFNTPIRYIAQGDIHFDLQHIYVLVVMPLTKIFYVWLIPLNLLV